MCLFSNRTAPGGSTKVERPSPTQPTTTQPPGTPNAPARAPAATAEPAAPGAASKIMAKGRNQPGRGTLNTVLTGGGSNTGGYAPIATKTLLGQ